MMLVTVLMTVIVTAAAESSSYLLRMYVSGTVLSILQARINEVL